MVRLSIEVLDEAPAYINTCRDRELNLRDYKIPVIENMGVTRDQFDTIDLTDNDIKKLDNMPLLKRLQTLYLHNNRVQYIAPTIGAQLPNLRTLALTNNNLCELGDIDALASCEKLEYVTFIGNPMTHKPNYRMYVIYRLPTVRVIDFKRVRDAERSEAKKLFKGKKNKKNLEEAMKKSAPVADGEEEAMDSSSAPSNERGLRAMTDEDREKIKAAIVATKSLAEVEYLQSLLASGRVPEAGWNRQMDLSRAGAADGAEGEKENNGFVPESEEKEAMEE